MQKIIISGGPGSGRAQLFEALKAEYPEADFVPEVATKVIDDQLNLENFEEDFTGIYPWTSYKDFARIVLDATIRLEETIPQDSKLVFQESSLIDNIAYNKLHNYYDLVSITEEKIKYANYAFALLCQPTDLDNLNNKNASYYLTKKEALIVHKYITESYKESGIDVVELPNVPVDERLKIIREVI